jgi:hypothetical protein
VDITNWNVNRARLRCFSCGRETWLDSFTISEFDPSKLFAAALVDQARRHRKRPPEERNGSKNSGGMPVRAREVLERATNAVPGERF